MSRSATRLQPTDNEIAKAPRAERWRFVLPVLAVYLVLAWIKVDAHVVWRDEWRHWQIARSTSNLSDLWAITQTEGHPALWFFCLYGLERVNSDVKAFQIFHTLIAAASIFVILRYSPFTRLQKVLLVFGYYFFFEYATISRNYAIGVLGLVLSLAAGCRRPASPILLGLGLALMFLSNVLAVILGGAVGAAFAVDWLVGRKTLGPISPLRIAGGAMIAAAGLGVTVYQMTRVPELSQMLSHAKHDLARAVSTVALAFCPIPRPVYAYWNTSLVEAVPGLGVILAVVLFVGLAALLWRRWGALTLWLIGPVSMAGFFYWKFPEAAARHWGHIYLCLVAALWLAASERQTGPSAPRLGLPMLRKRWLSWVFTGLLLVQAAGGVWDSALDLVRPFSQAKAASQYIREHGLAKLPMVGHSADVATSISGYLNTPIYLPANREFAYCDSQDITKRYRVNDQVIAGEAIRLAVERKSDVLVVLAGWAPWPKEMTIQAGPPGGPPKLFRIQHLASFEPTVAPDETYHLFLVIPQN